MSCFGPGDAAWDAYYANPTDTSKWAAFCAGAGGSVVVQAIGVPACGPTGTTNISLKNGSTIIYTPGFQCVELTDRYLYVKKGWTSLPGNGARVARAYAAAHSMSTVTNGTVGTAPHVGDVISFSNVSDFSDTGHAAVVSASAVDGSGNGSVTILNQNVTINGAPATAATVNLTVSNWNVNKLGFSFLEWLPVGVAATNPGVPTSVSAVGGNASAQVSFTAPASDGGSPITGYRVTASPGGKTATGASSPLTVSGLTNGTAYTFTVHATNAVGNSAESAASNPVTPAAPPVTISARNAGVTETNAGSTLNFKVVLSAAATSNVSVQYATADKTAKAPADYTATSGTLTFTPGQITKTVSVPVAGDTLYELTETFFLNVSNPVGATIADAQGVGTIKNDDAKPSVTIADVTKAEGASGAKTKFAFTVTLSTVSGAATTVKWATADGTAVAGSDYTAASGTVSIPAGVTSKTFTVFLIGDATVEPNETFFVNLTSPVNATIADTQAVGAITNDD